MRRSLVVVTLAVLAWAFTVAISDTWFVRRNDLHILDLAFYVRQQLGVRVPVDPAIELVLIDDAARQANPLPPQLWGPNFLRGIAALMKAGAQVVGLDFELLKMPAPEDLDDATREALVALGEFEGAGAVKKTERGGVIFINGLDFDNRGQVSVSMPPDWMTGVLGEDAFALANLTRDQEDGRYRAQSLLPLHAMQTKGNLRGWDFFAPAIAARARGVLFEDGAGATVRWGDVVVPVLSSTDKRLLINYVGRGRFPRTSWQDIVTMQPDALRQKFAGKIVLIGLGSRQDQDIVDTPLDDQTRHREPGGLDAQLFDTRIGRSMLGVEAHANALNTLLTGTFLRRAPRWLNQLFMLLVCLAAAFEANRLRPLPMALVCAGIMAVWLLIGLTIFIWGGVWIDVAAAVPAALLASTLVGLYRYISVRKLFGQFVSNEVADELMADASRGSLGATSRCDATVLFSDINGFSTASEEHSAEEVIRMLNDHFHAMVEVIERHHGWLKQFVGDEIMAVFGVPRPLPNAERAAVETALDMVDALARAKQSGIEGFYEVKIGIHSGEVIVGNVGTESRAERAVVGDNVNLGSRIMGMAKGVGAVILVSEVTYERVKGMAGVDFVDHGEHEVKGRRRRIRIYEVRRS